MNPKNEINTKKWKNLFLAINLSKIIPDMILKNELNTKYRIANSDISLELGTLLMEDIINSILFKLAMTEPTPRIRIIKRNNTSFVDIRSKNSLNSVKLLSGIF